MLFTKALGCVGILFNLYFSFLLLLLVSLLLLIELVTPDYCALGLCHSEAQQLDAYINAGISFISLKDSNNKFKGQTLAGYHFAGTCAVGKVVDENTLGVYVFFTCFALSSPSLFLPFSPLILYY